MKTLSTKQILDLIDTIQNETKVVNGQDEEIKDSFNLLREETKAADNLLTELDKRINDCRHYLMGVQPEDLTVENALEALGFQRNGNCVW
jgi:chromosome segregation ATPase